MKLGLRLVRERLRGAWQRGAEALAPAPPRIRLSIAIIAQDCAPELRGLLANVADIADEVVVVDGGSVDPDMRAIYAANPRLRLIERPWDGHFGRQKNAALDACSGDWILHLDSDERVGPELKRRLPKLCAGGADFLRLPMYWLTSEDPARFVLSQKHYPCFVPRLMRNRPEFRYCDDAPVHVRFPRAITRSMKKVHGAHLYHYCFAWLDRAALEDKAARYRRDHPGSEATTEAYYRYWRHPHRLVSCGEGAIRSEELRPPIDSGGVE